jgi:hypothetical protein
VLVTDRPIAIRSTFHHKTYFQDGDKVESDTLALMLCAYVTQVKADLIHQREIELLVPAAGPGASEVLRLLRPAAASRSVDAVSVLPITAQKQSKLPRKMSFIAETSFSMSAATLEAAAAASVFGSSRALAPTAESNTAEGLLGLSCTIGARGEVSSIWFQIAFRQKSEAELKGHLLRVIQT